MTEQSGLPEPTRLDGKVAVVTGGASGIGAATARRLAELGASVLIVDRNGDAARTEAGDLTSVGLAVESCEADVAVEHDVARAMDLAVESFGPLDIVHNNAAYIGGRDIDVATLDPRDFDRTMAITARGVMLGCKHALRHMLPAGGGAIVNTSSSGSLTVEAGRVAYNAAKAAVNSVTRSVASRYGRVGIRCNAVLPGIVRTPAVENGIPEIVQAIERHVPIGRAGEPTEIAHMVAFLAGPAASYVNGAMVLVDGGMSTGQPFVADLYGW